MKNPKLTEKMKKQWAKVPKKERSEFASAIATIKNKKMTKRERSEHAKMMLQKRYHGEPVMN